MNPHRAVQLPLLTTQTRAYTLPQFTTHTCQQLLLFLTQTDPNTPPPYSCESTQSLQLPLLTTQTGANILPQFITHTSPHNSSYSLPKQTLTLLLIPVNPHRAVHCATPLTHNPNTSLYTPSIHNPHMPTTPLIPYTPPYSCESTQSCATLPLTAHTGPIHSPPSQPTHAHNSSYSIHSSLFL